MCSRSLRRYAGIPFYGYHVAPKLVLKVNLYNPAMVLMARNLLMSPDAPVMRGKVFTVYEAHLGFSLQVHG